MHKCCKKKKKKTASALTCTLIRFYFRSTGSRWPEVKFNLPVYGQLHVISAIPVRIYLSTHSIIEMEIGIYITATIIYLGRELCLGVCVGCCPLLAKWIVATPFVGRHFFCVLWLLAGDVRRMTCSFIALALEVHVFSLLPEAEGAILRVTSTVCRMRSEFKKVPVRFRPNAASGGCNRWV